MKNQSAKSKKLKGQSQVFIQSLVNRNIGSRTGKDVKAGKKIDKDEDGFDNFEAYWSESDADVTSNTTAHSMCSYQSGGLEKENQSTNHRQVTASQPERGKVSHRVKQPSVDTYSSQPIGGAAAYYFGHRAVGSRTGKNIKAGKNIRKFDDSFENFENYWSESEPDSILSFHKNVPANDSRSFVSSQINAEVPQEQEEENVSGVFGEHDSEVFINSKHLSAIDLTREASQHGDSVTTQDIEEQVDKEEVGDDKDTSLLEGANASEDAKTGDTDDDGSADKSRMFGVAAHHDSELKIQAMSDQSQDGPDHHVDYQADQQVTKRMSDDHVPLSCSYQIDVGEVDGGPQEQSAQSAYREMSQDNGVTGTYTKRPDSMNQSGLSTEIQQGDVADTEEVKSPLVEEDAAQACPDEITHTQHSLQGGVEGSHYDESRNGQHNESTMENPGGETSLNVSIKETVPSRRTRSQSRGIVGSFEGKTNQSVRLSGSQSVRQQRQEEHGTEEEDVTVSLSSAKEMASSIKKSKSKKKKNGEKGTQRMSNIEVSASWTDNEGDKTESAQKSKRRRDRGKASEGIRLRRSNTGRKAGARRSARKNAAQKSHLLNESQGIVEEKGSEENVGQSLIIDKDSKVLTDSVHKPKTYQSRTGKSKQTETSTVDEELEKITINYLSDTQQISTSKKSEITLKTNRKSKELSETEEVHKNEVIKLTEEDNTTTVFKLKAVKSTRKSVKPGHEQKYDLKRKSLASNHCPTVKNVTVKEYAYVSSQDESVDASTVDSSPEGMFHKGSNDQSPADDVVESSDAVGDKPCDGSDVASADSSLEKENTALPQDVSNAENSEEMKDVKENSVSNKSETSPVACPKAAHKAAAAYETSGNTYSVQVDGHCKETTPRLIVEATSGKSFTVTRLNIGGDVTGSISKNTDVTGAVSNTPMHSFRTKKRLSYSKIFDESLEMERQECLTSAIARDESVSSKQPVRLESVKEHDESDTEDPNTEFISLQPSTKASMTATDTDSMDENFWVVDEDIKEKKRKGKTGKEDTKVTCRKSSVDSADIHKTEIADNKNTKKGKMATEKKYRKRNDVTGGKKSVKNSIKRKGKKSLTGDKTMETNSEPRTDTKKTKRKGVSVKGQTVIDTVDKLDEVKHVENCTEQQVMCTESPVSTNIRKRKSQDPSNVNVSKGGKKSKSARVTKTMEVMNGCKKNITVTSGDSICRLSHLNLAGVGETPKSGVSFRQQRRRTLSESEKTKLNTSADLSFSPHTDDFQATRKQANRRQSSLSSKPLSPSASVPLTPCLVQSGSVKSMEKKKRRVTISNIIEKASVSYTDSSVSDSRLSPGHSSSAAGHTYSTLMDGDITGSPVHIFETTNTEQPDPITAPPKTKIIYPKPGPEGLRRSQRVRLQPLEWYKNEHVIYQRRKSGNFVIAGIQPSKEAEYIAAELEKKKRRAKQQLKQTKRSIVSRSKLLSRPNLSIHQELPTELDYTIHSELPIINPDTKEEVLVDCVAPIDNTLYVGSGGDSPREGDPYIICHAIQQPTFTAGHLLLAPLAEKPTQILSENTLIFTIVHGKLSVTIHRGSTVLEAGDQFFVPRGNTYCLKNLRNEEAKLSFVNLIEEDGS